MFVLTIYFLSYAMRRAHAWKARHSRVTVGRSMSTEKHFQDSVDNPSPRFYLLILQTKLQTSSKRGVWHDGSTSGVRASSSGRPGRGTFPDTGGSRGVRHRSHLAAATPARACASRHHPVRGR